jgi:hypothetical protein
MPILIGRFINGICLNPIEYVLDKPRKMGGVPLKFDDEHSAIAWLKEHCDNPEHIQEDIDNSSILLVKED